jgi:adenylate cyclase
MEQLASPGQAYLTAHTARLAQGYFALRDLGAFALKGSEEPLGVFELEGVGAVRTRLDVSRSRGLSRFVGRGDELAMLDAALEQALEGQGQVVGVVADAGVGKSRLCFEFIERCRARGISIYEGHCPAHGKTIPFLPVFELLRGYFGIGESDSNQAAREKVVGRLLLLDRAFEDTFPLVFDFLGIGEPGERGLSIDPEGQQRQLFAFVRHLLHARSVREPAVILIDDLHWIDPGSDAFVAQVVETVGNTRTLVLVNFRPEYEAAWTRRTNYRQIPLVPLGPEAVTELIVDMLGGDASVAGLPALIRERTGGNPFFTEEILQSLIESDYLQGTKGAYRLLTAVERLEVPGTVHSVLAARIDRLPEREKHVLQTAAVIGREFDEPCLVRIADQAADDLVAALHALESHEFVVEESLYPRAEYAFKHPLTHEVAYNSQLASRRAGIHAAVAGAIEALEPDKLEERAALIAQHWELAGERLKAASWNARAAQRSRVGDPAACLRQWQKVHELVRTDSDSSEAEALRMQACLQIVSVGGWRLGGGGQAMEAIFNEGKALGARRGDTTYLAELALGYAAFIGLSTGDMATYAERAREVGRLADQTEDRDLQCAACIIIAYSHFRIGRLYESLEFALRARELSADDHTLGARSVGINAYTWSFFQVPWTELCLGRGTEARTGLDQGVALARRSNDAENLVWALGTSADVERVSGELANGEADAVEALGIADGIGAPFLRLFAFLHLGVARLVRHDWSGAIDAFEAGLSVVHEARTGLEQEPLALAGLAEAHCGAGRLEIARETAERAIAAARACGMPVGELEGQLALARVLLADAGKITAGRAAAITTALDRAGTVVEECRARGFEPLVLVERARFAARVGDDGARTRYLREAHRLFTDIGATGHARRLGEEVS